MLSGHVVTLHLIDQDLPQGLDRGAVRRTQIDAPAGDGHLACQGVACHADPGFFDLFPTTSFPPVRQAIPAWPPQSGAALDAWSLLFSWARTRGPIIEFARVELRCL